MTGPIVHGTYGGYQACRPAGVVCDPCRRACAEYQRRYRKANPDKQAAARRLSNARVRALGRLAKMYPVEFRKLYDEEIVEMQRREAAQR